LNSNTVFEVLISFGSEFHTFGPLKEKLDLYNSVFGFGTTKLSDDENLVLYYYTTRTVHVTSKLDTILILVILNKWQ